MCFIAVLMVAMVIMLLPTLSVSAVVDETFTVDSGSDGSGAPVQIGAPMMFTIPDEVNHNGITYLDVIHNKC